MQTDSRFVERMLGRYRTLRLGYVGVFLGQFCGSIPFDLPVNQGNVQPPRVHIISGPSCRNPAQEHPRPGYKHNPKHHPTNRIFSQRLRWSRHAACYSTLSLVIICS